MGGVSGRGAARQSLAGDAGGPVVVGGPGVGLVDLAVFAMIEARYRRR
jgi:hypothetical protein